MLTISISFTCAMTLLWIYRFLRYWKLYKIERAERSMSGLENSLMGNA